MEIAHTLAVDGYIKANSENTISTSTNGASGGSGGSILIQTFNFTGMFYFIYCTNTGWTPSKPDNHQIWTAM